MPVLIPSADEIAAMPPLARAKARKAVARIVSDATAALDDMVADGARRAQSDAEWGRRVRDEARRMLALMPAEPADVAASRRAALAAIGSHRDIHSRREVGDGPDAASVHSDDHRTG